MTKRSSKTQNLKFFLLTVVLIFASPWIYKLIFTLVGGKVHELSYFIIALTAFFIGLLYTRSNAKLWLLLVCIVFLPAFAWELKSFLSFEMAYANNEVHIAPSDFMPEGEMYRDFDSYYDFTYGNNYWNGLSRLLYYQIIWLTVPFATIMIRRSLFKQVEDPNLIDR